MNDRLGRYGNTRWAGVALLAATGLLVTRMIPLAAGVPRELLADFPPQSAEGIARLVDANRVGWRISHVMALIAFGLFLLGSAAVHRHVASRRDTFVSLAAFLGWATGLGLYTIAVVIDGFVVPLAAVRYTSAGAEAAPAAALVLSMLHETALAFFAPALLVLFIGVGLLGASLLLSRTVHPAVGWAGAALGTLALVGYVFGLFGPRWTAPAFPPLFLAFAAWIVVLGIALVRRGRVPPDVTPSGLTQPA